MAIPVIASTRTGALYVWVHDDCVEAPVGLHGWVPLTEATVRPGADVVEVAALSAEDCAVVSSMTGPAGHYEAARRCLRAHQQRGAKSDRWERGRALHDWAGSLCLDAVAELSLLAHALSYGRDYQELLGELYGAE